MRELLDALAADDTPDRILDRRRGTLPGTAHPTGITADFAATLHSPLPSD
jgi:hypothetical protein